MRTLLLATVFLVACGGSSSNDSGNGSTGGSGGSGGSAAGKGEAGSSAGTGAAAGTSGGGSSSVGGNGGSSEAGECGPTVTFRLTVGAANDTEYCLGGQSACNIDWFWLLDTEGNTMSTGLSCGATSCDGCLATGCPLICLTPSPLSPEGDQATWNGVRYVEDTCGEGTLCQQPSCAAPGDYVARFCAYPLVGAGGSPGFDECSRAAQDPTCVEVPFSYPSSGVVEAVLE